MAIDIGWAQAPDKLQGATATVTGSGSVLYVFPNAQLGVAAIRVGNEAMNDTPFDIHINECHVHVRNDAIDTIHVTWVLEPDGGLPAKYYEWFSCTPGGGATLTNSAGASGFLSANPDLDSRVWLRFGEQMEDVVSAIDEHTEAYSIMLATELAATMTIANPDAGPASPNRTSGVPLGWAFVDFTIAGARSQLRGSDAVWTFGAPVATAGGYPVQSCELWISPNQEWSCQIVYRLADTLPIDVSHWYTLDGAGNATRSTESLTADGSAAPAGATAASAELWSASDGIAAAAAKRVYPV
jgi:hypothetical protein